MKEKFENFKFKGETLKVIEQANSIIEEYQEQGYELTLRQLYYQFVARGLIANSQRSYSRLGDIISNARLNGDLDWAAIKDRTRELEGVGHDQDPASAIEWVADNYHIDLRKGQPIYIETWVEKEALAGVVGKACRQFDVNYFACRGYVSQTAMYEASKRFQRRQRYGAERCLIIHLGDHDPSGIDMTRDIEERLNNTFGVPTTIKRIALNMPQVEEFNPPPNPAKLTDSRVDGYIERFGDLSWELDALEPKIITSLIHHEIIANSDMDLFKDRMKLQEEQKELLVKCSLDWDNIAERLNEEYE